MDIPFRYVLVNSLWNNIYIYHHQQPVTNATLSQMKSDLHEVFCQLDYRRGFCCFFVEIDFDESRINKLDMFRSENTNAAIFLIYFNKTKLRYSLLGIFEFPLREVCT